MTKEPDVQKTPYDDLLTCDIQETPKTGLPHIDSLSETMKYIVGKTTGFYYETKLNDLSRLQPTVMEQVYTHVLSDPNKYLKGTYTHVATGQTMDLQWTQEGALTVFEKDTLKVFLHHEKDPEVQTRAKLELWFQTPETGYLNNRYIKDDTKAFAKLYDLTVQSQKRFNRD
jgi:hypothetical protein